MNLNHCFCEIKNPRELKVSTVGHINLFNTRYIDATSSCLRNSTKSKNQGIHNSYHTRHSVHTDMSPVHFSAILPTPPWSSTQKLDLPTHYLVIKVKGVGQLQMWTMFMKLNLKWNITKHYITATVCALELVLTLSLSLDLKRGLCIPSLVYNNRNQEQ